MILRAKENEMTRSSCETCGCALEAVHGDHVGHEELSLDAACVTYLRAKVKSLQAEVETVLRNAAAGERARLAQKLRVEYPLNRHAREWADWILRDSVEQKFAP